MKFIYNVCDNKEYNNIFYIYNNKKSSDQP